MSSHERGFHDLGPEQEPDLRPAPSASKPVTEKPRIHHVITPMGGDRWTFKCACGYAMVYETERKAQTGLKAHWGHKHK